LWCRWLLLGFVLLENPDPDVDELAINIGNPRSVKVPTKVGTRYMTQATINR
jgi:hypothetical protein